MTPFQESSAYFATPIQEFVFYDKYSRFRQDLGRRETWPEAVKRTTDFLRELSGDELDDSVYQEIHDGILKMEIAPSMRLMATAGPAARRAPESTYNCAFIPMVSVDAVTELLWVSMCGVGAGYSVEKRYTDLLPVIANPDQSLNHDHDILFTIPDTTEGWVEALKLGLEQWFNGHDVTYDYSLIRPAGSVLETKGGTASGPECLQDLLDFARELIQSRAGQKLRSIDVYDLCTKVGDAAVSGGSRRSAQLTMFDLNDEAMLRAKSGEFWKTHSHRANANVSAVFEQEMTHEFISEFMQIMFDNGTGESGIVSRAAMNSTKPLHRRAMPHGGVNGCSEVSLQGATSDGRFGGQFCNLSTVIVRPGDTASSLRKKTRLATIVGTIQAMATNFKMLRPTWQEICEEERLLGVSLIGVTDSRAAQNPETQRMLRDCAIEVNGRYARRLGINQAAAITTIKPAGNSSVMYGTARGINARYAQHYTRRVRVNKHTPLFSVLSDAGIPLEPDIVSQNGTWVAEFYEKSPDGATTINELSAIDQLENWKSAKVNWAQHNVSVTIEYGSEEQEAIIDWVYENQDIMNGIAFLPRTDHVYQQAPYSELSAEDYEELSADYPAIDFSLLEQYETVDTTTRTVECGPDSCDLI